MWRLRYTGVDVYRILYNKWTVIVSDVILSGFDCTLYIQDSFVILKHNFTDPNLD